MEIVTRRSIEVMPTTLLDVKREIRPEATDEHGFGFYLTDHKLLKADGATENQSYLARSDLVGSIGRQRLKTQHAWHEALS